VTIVRTQRLFLLLFILLGSTSAIGLALLALQKNINLYYSPTQMINNEAPVYKIIRGGGIVTHNSLEKNPDSLQVTFSITDGKGTIRVQFDGILPDLFTEGQGIVGTGHLGDDGVFYADEILAKHDAVYMPPEVKHALDMNKNTQSADSIAFPHTGLGT